MWETFLQHVPLNEVQDLFPHYRYRHNQHTKEWAGSYHLKDDLSTSFWKSKYRGQTCYYIVWSGIEYIWTEQG